MYSLRKYTMFHVLTTRESCGVVEVAYSGGLVYHGSSLQVLRGNSLTPAIPRLYR
jgi:hypothetical protein